MSKTIGPFPKRSLISLTFGSGGWLFLVVLLVAIGIIAISLAQKDMGQRLDANGRNTTAIVIKMASRINNGTGTNKSHTRSFTVSYQFKTADGANIRDIQNVSEGFYNSVAKGDQRPVRYLPSDPKTSEIEIGRGTRAGSNFLMLAVLLIVVGFGGIAIWFRRARAKIKLRDTGEVRHAQVMAHEPIVRGKSGKTPPKYGHATWRDKAGNVGQTGALLIDKLPGVGQSITLYTGPSGKPAVWEGEVGSR
ncbi:MAG: DUF3592 domain-containing protein [Alphaproteobacteria bacterium]|nr:DUF3592 domain-containing protein [Alphaproteobacteria bacterium]